MELVCWKFWVLLALLCGAVWAGKKEDCLAKKCSNAVQRLKPTCQTFCQQNPTRCKSDKPEKSEPPGPLDCTEFTSEEECIQKKCNDLTNTDESTKCQKLCDDYWRNCGVD